MPIRRLTLLVFVCLFANTALAQDAVLTLDQPETAGISAFRAHWDTPIPLSEDGVTKFVDAVIKDRPGPGTATIGIPCRT